MNYSEAYNYCYLGNMDATISSTLLYNNTVRKLTINFVFSNPIALRKSKIVYNFGFSECNRVNVSQ